MRGRVFFLVFLLVGVAVAGLVTAQSWPMWWLGPNVSQLSTAFSYGYPNTMYGRMMGWCPCYGWFRGPDEQRLTIQQALDVLERYVDGLGGNFRIHDVMEFQYNFYAVVVERETGIGAFELLVNPLTGRIYPEPGPNMMWNTKYGMHYGWNISPTAEMPITPEQAKEIAYNYLRNRFAGSVEVENPMRFFGYYTIDYKLDGKVHGMLSVNGFTGQVWYHGWHGPFIQEIELEVEH